MAESRTFRVDTPFLRSCSRWDRKARIPGGSRSVRSRSVTGLFRRCGKKPQQQDQAVTIAVDGVRTGSPKAGKMIGEVVADYGSRAGSEQPLFIGASAAIAVEERPVRRNDSQTARWLRFAAVR